MKNTTNPKVSVIIPTYNSSETIFSCVDSVLSQRGWFSVEVIVVDNCSTDDTVEIVRSQFPDVKVVVNERNYGAPNFSRNKGLDMCKGEYVCFLDSDDYWTSRKVQTQLYAIRNVDVCVTATYSIWDKRISGVYEDSDSVYITFPENKVFRDKLRRTYKYPTYMSSIMIRRSALGHIRFEQEHGGMDFDYVLKITENRKVAHVNIPCVYRGGRGLSVDSLYRLQSYNHTHHTLSSMSKEYLKDTRVGIVNNDNSYGRYLFFVGRYKEARRFLHPFSRVKVFGLYLLSYLPFLRRRLLPSSTTL